MRGWSLTTALARAWPPDVSPLHSDVLAVPEAASLVIAPHARNMYSVVLFATMQFVDCLLFVVGESPLLK